MVLEAVQLPLFDHRRLLKALRELETFDLGERIVGGDVTHYWVKRLKSGRKWKVTWTVGRRVRVVGTFTSEEVLEYFRDMRVHIDPEGWVTMGWRPHDGDYGRVLTAPVVEWKCVLSRHKGGGFMLTAFDAVTDEYLDGRPTKLRDGLEIYTAAAALAKRMGYPLLSEELPRIAAQIGKIDTVAADQFRRGPQLLKQRQEAARQRAEAKRQAKLRPFRNAIDAYVATLSDVPMQWGSPRVRVKRFMEQFVIAHGRFPSGRHTIHDFSDLRRYGTTVGGGG